MRKIWTTQSYTGLVWSDLVVMFLRGECWGWNLVWRQIIVDTIIVDCNLDVMPLLTRLEFAKYVGSNMLSWGEGVNLITLRRQFEIG